MKHKLLFAITISSLLGCSTLNTVLKEKEKGKGTKVVYNIQFEDAWLLSKSSFRWAGSDAIEEHKGDGYMLTSKGKDMITSGSVMGAWIESISSNEMAVTVISKRRNSLDLFTGMTENKYHKYFKTGMDILKNGKELPLMAPEISE